MTGPHDEEEPVRCTCGRALRDPESVARKAGPTCWRKLHGRPRRQPHRPAPATPPTEGQLALNLDPWTDGIHSTPPPLDLWGQGITARQIHAITDIPLTGSYL